MVAKPMYCWINSAADSVLREQKFKTPSKPAGGYPLFKNPNYICTEKNVAAPNNQKREDKLLRSRNRSHLPHYQKAQPAVPYSESTCLSLTRICPQLTQMPGTPRLLDTNLKFTRKLSCPLKLLPVCVIHMYNLTFMFFYILI